MQTGTENVAGIETGTRSGTGTKKVIGSGNVTGTGYGLWYCLCLVLAALQPRLLLVANKGILNYTSSWISRLIKCAEPHKQSSDPLPIPSPVSVPGSPLFIAIR